MILNNRSVLLWAMFLIGGLMADIIEVTPKGEERVLQGGFFTNQSKKVVKSKTLSPSMPPTKPPTPHPTSKPTVKHHPKPHPEPENGKGKGGKGDKGDKGSSDKGGKGGLDKGGKGKGGKGDRRGDKHRYQKPGDKLHNDSKTDGKGEGKGESKSGKGKGGSDSSSKSGKGKGGSNSKSGKGKGKGGSKSSSKNSPGKGEVGKGVKPPVGSMPTPTDAGKGSSAKGPITRPPAEPTAPTEPTAPSTPTTPTAPPTPVPTMPTMPSTPSMPTDNPPSPSVSTLAPTPSNADSVSGSPYILLYTTTESRIPSISEYAALTDLTRIFLDEFAASQFAGTSLTIFEDFLTTQLRNSFTLNQPVEAEYSAVGLFNPSSIFLPTMGEINGLLMRAFSGDNLIEYIRRLNALPSDNVFSTTADVDMMMSTTSPSSRSSDKREAAGNTSSMAGVAAGAAGIAILAMGFLVYRRRQRSDDSIYSSGFDDKHKDSGDNTVAGGTYCEDSVDGCSVSVRQGRPYVIRGPAAGGADTIYELDDETDADQSVISEGYGPERFQDEYNDMSVPRSSKSASFGAESGRNKFEPIITSLSSPLS